MKPKDISIFLLGMMAGVLALVVPLIIVDKIAGFEKNEVVMADVVDCADGGMWDRKLSVVVSKQRRIMYTVKTIDENGSLSNNYYVTPSVYKHGLIKEEK